jgi:hypothetical protein
LATGLVVKVKTLPIALALLLLLASLPSGQAQVGLPPPMNLQGRYDAQNHTVVLSWDPPLGAGNATLTYNVYQDGQLQATVSSTLYQHSVNVTLTRQASLFAVTAVRGQQESAPALHVVEFNAVFGCQVFSVDVPWVGIDWACLFSILHTYPFKSPPPPRVPL